MRVLLTTQAMPSHFGPLVPLARALRKAGHEVAVATGPPLLPAVRELGFEALAAGPDWNDDPEVARLRTEMRQRPGPEGMAFALPELFGRWAGGRTLPEMATAVESWRPDLLVSEVSEFTGGLVAERCGLPFCAVTFGIDMPTEVAKSLLGDAIAALRREAGLEPEPEVHPFDGILRLCFAPRSYQPPELPLSPLAHVLRPEPFDAAAGETLPAWVEELPERPTVYATLGTIFADQPGVFEAIVDGLAQEPVNVVATVSREVDPSRLRGRAPNLRVEQYIPNSLLLPHCDAVVAHAGYGTVMGCLAAGVPMLLVPLGADQFLHAGRCEQLGVARTLAVDAVDPEAVRGAVRAVLGDPEQRRVAADLRDEIAAMPGVDRAVPLLEELVRTGRPPRRA